MESSANCEKLVSASSYLYVCQHVAAQRPLNGLVSFMKICRENPYLIQIQQKYRALYIKTYARFIATGDINSPQKHF